ncbi:tripartite tricarboxylate transporter TctB family protein [Arthrobacter monumenti]
MIDSNIDSAQLSRGKLGTRIAAAVIILGAAVVLFDAFRIASEGGFGPQQPGFFPVIVGIGLMGFGIAFLVRTTLKPDYDLREQAAEEHADTHWRTLWTVIVGLVIYAYVLEPIGYIPATAIFFVAIAWVGGSRKWIRDIIVAVLFSVAVYFFFTEVLGVRLPAGLMEMVL